MEFTLTNEQLIELKKLKKNKVSILINTILPLLGFTLIFYILPVITIALYIDPEGRSVIEYRSLQILTGILFTLAYIKVIDYFFIGAIFKLNKDIKRRTGIVEKHLIIRKQYFPLTQDMYFFFEKSTMPNIEVDLETFNKFKEGDYYTVLKAKHSKIVLQDIHRREINMDAEFDELGQYDDVNFFS